MAQAKLKALRNFLAFLSVAALIFPLHFLLLTPVSKLLLPEDPRRLTGVEVTNRRNVVLVVFDEFSGAALMKENREINALRYPNFATLARDSYWFPYQPVVEVRGPKKTGQPADFRTPLAVPSNCPQVPSPLSAPNTLSAKLLRRKLRTGMSSRLSHSTWH